MRLERVDRGHAEVGDAHDLLGDRHGGGHEVHLALHGLLQDHVHREHAVDLVGAFENPVDAGIAVAALHAGLGRVAHAAVDLDRLVDDQVEHLGSEDLHHGALRGEVGNALQRGLALLHAARLERLDGVVDVLSGPVGGRFAGVDLDGALAELVADGPVLRDGPAELVALVGVLHGAGDRPLGAAEHRAAEFDAADVEDVDRDFEALAALVKQVLDRDLDVVEEDLTGGRSLDAHLLLLGVLGDPLAVAVDDEGREVLVVVNLGKDDHHVGKSAVGDPHLLAVDDVMLSVLGQLGGGLAAVGVRSAAGLGQAVAALEFPRGHARDVLLFLRFVAVVEDGQGADAGVGGEAHAEGVSVAERLGDQHGRLEVEAHAAELLRDARAEEAEFAGLFHERFGQAFLLVVDGVELGVDVLGDEIHRHLLHHPLLLIPFFRNEDVARCGLADEPLSAGDGLAGLAVGILCHDKGD